MQYILCAYSSSGIGPNRFKYMINLMIIIIPQGEVLLITLLPMSQLKLRKLKKIRQLIAMSTSNL